jgi:phosphopantothenoylcysteine synthetase/decarboxylase
MARVTPPSTTLGGVSVVVTAGGTQQPLDDVRFLTNMSTGRTGARLAEECLRRGAHVHYLHGRGALLPFRRSQPIDLSAGRAAALALLENLPFEEVPGRLSLHEARTVEDLLQELRTLLTTPPRPVAILHAMAVSDYTAPARPGKISSDADELVIHLERAPKVIGHVKEWAPAIVQVGFKLLSGVTAEELYEAGLALCRRSNSDLILANDLQTIAGEHHPMLAIWPDGSRAPIEHDTPRRVIDLLEGLLRDRAAPAAAAGETHEEGDPR